MADPHLDRLFIAIPELTYSIPFVDAMLKAGAIDQAQFDRIMDARRAAKKAGKIMDSGMRGTTLVNRIMAVGAEMLTIESVNILRAAKLLTETQGHGLRLAIRTLGVGTRGGLPTDKSQIFSRLIRVLGVNASVEMVDLLRNLGFISTGEAEKWRGYIRSGTVVKESLAKARRAKNLLDAIMILGGIPINKGMVSGMVQAGILTPRLARVYNALTDLGVKQWKVFSGLHAAEGYRARLVLALTGSMNAQLLDYLLITKVITREQWTWMQFLEIASRQVNDRLLEDLVKRKYRVMPGEAPIKTFARASRVSEGELLSLLADAAEEARKEAMALAGSDKIGANTRSRQYRLAAAGLHSSLRNMWEGVGYIAIRGERDVAEAAAEAALKMQRSLLTGKFDQLGESLLWQSKAGVDSYISREENTLRLSRTVYKNLALYRGRVDKRIALSLLQGRSPDEIANDVKMYISPRTPGGVSYAAKRLARTEINNAFHFSTIRFTREHPWVRGYQWHLSGSHGHPDICNQMAEDDHDGLGSGIYKKANVPGKPHPHCLCYITVEQMSPDEFIAAHKAGRFNAWYRLVDRASAYDPPDSGVLSAYVQRGFTNFAAGLDIT